MVKKKGRQDRDGIHEAILSPFLFIPSLYASILNSQGFLFTCLRSFYILLRICLSKGAIIEKNACCRHGENLIRM